MTLKSDTKFDEKLSLGSKNDMRNWMNFNVSSRKSENLQFDANFVESTLSLSQKKYRGVVRHKTGEWLQNLKTYLCFEKDMRNLANFDPTQFVF